MKPVTLTKTYIHCIVLYKCCIAFDTVAWHRPEELRWSRRQNASLVTVRGVLTSAEGKRSKPAIRLCDLVGQFTCSFYWPQLQTVASIRPNLQSFKLSCLIAGLTSSHCHLRHTDFPESRSNFPIFIVKMEMLKFFALAPPHIGSHQRKNTWCVEWSLVEKHPLYVCMRTCG